MNLPTHEAQYLDELIDKAMSTTCHATLCVYERQFSERAHSLIAQGYSVVGYIQKFWDVFYGGKR